jgi:hypothetical protein
MDGETRNKKQKTKKPKSKEYNIFSKSYLYYKNLNKKKHGRKKAK